MLDLTAAASMMLLSEYGEIKEKMRLLIQFCMANLNSPQFLCDESGQRFLADLHLRRDTLWKRKVWPPVPS